MKRMNVLILILCALLLPVKSLAIYWTADLADSDFMDHASLIDVSWTKTPFNYDHAKETAYINGHEYLFEAYGNNGKISELQLHGRYEDLILPLNDVYSDGLCIYDSFYNTMLAVYPEISDISDVIWANKVYDLLDTGKTIATYSNDWQITTLDKRAFSASHKSGLSIIISAPKENDYFHVFVGYGL